MSDLQCPARILLVRERPAVGPGGVRAAAEYDAPVDLAELADRHRGETVLVVGEHPHGPGDVLVEIDADGWRVTPWDGGDAEARLA